MPEARIEGGLRTQIKTRDRVRDLAEVYTHEREVKAMLDLVASMFPSPDDRGNHDRTFLEPACGSGNFLEEILRRKLSTVTAEHYGRGQRYEHRLLRCLASIYGIDIDNENVQESRNRLRAVITSHLDNDLNTTATSEGLASAVEVVLETNIIQADTLKDAENIRLISYRPGRVGHFTRVWSLLREPRGQIGLFAAPAPQPVRDAVPIHYRDLQATPEPTLVRPETGADT